MNQLLRLCLQPGEIALGVDGKGLREILFIDLTVSDLDVKYQLPEFPDMSIMLALNKYWLLRAKEILYCENLWIMPLKWSCEMEPDFFYHWHAEDLRLLPSVVLDPALEVDWQIRVDASRKEIFASTRLDTLEEISNHLARPVSEARFAEVWAYRKITLTDLMGSADGNNNRFHRLPDPEESVEALQNEYDIFPVVPTPMDPPRRILARPAQAQRLFLHECSRAYLELVMREIQSEWDK